MARTEGVWQEYDGSYLRTPWAEGRNILINGTSKYLNFGSLVGETGYGFRDNAGTIQWKNSSGSWQNIGTGGGGGAVDSVNGQTGVVVLDADDISDASTTNKWATAAEKTKLGYISVTQAVDLDALESASHAAVTVADSAEIDFTLTGQQISASIVAGSIDETKLDASVNASLDLADSASQPGHTHTASAITDFDTEVSNNTDVAANTAARHNPVTVSGTPDYITLVGQDLVRGQIDLATDVTGDLPFANLTQLSAHQVLGRAGAGTGDVAGITMGNDTILGRSGSGDIDDLSATQVRAILNVADGATAYTNENAQDAVGTILTDTTSIDLIYDDAGNTISAQREALIGDVTAPKNSNTTTLATVNSNVGSFGLAGSVAQFTVNAKGLITAAANVAISITAAAVSDFAATVRATVLTGLSTATSTAVTAADSILVAIGKLQAQNTAQDAAIAGKANSSHTHPLSDLTQSSATTGQVATWNGSAWVPQDPSGGGGDTSFERLDFQVQTAPATPSADTVTVYMTGTGTSPSRVLEWKMKNEDGEEIILATLVT